MWIVVGIVPAPSSDVYWFRLVRMILLLWIITPRASRCMRDSGEISNLSHLNCTHKFPVAVFLLHIYLPPSYFHSRQDTDHTYHICFVASHSIHQIIFVCHNFWRTAKQEQVIAPSFHLRYALVAQSSEVGCEQDQITDTILVIHIGNSSANDIQLAIPGLCRSIVSYLCMQERAIAL